ncbi:hypothetical protein [Streptomyces hygroscopicus]|uniref:hypothetical protein n=1 Tax=Streptomyces hygroscopicus TaxID=1912 RepID=UPI0037A03498
MDGETLKLVREAISAERFDRYQQGQPGPEAEARALRRYVWNIEASAAFFGPLHILEVVMRNAMHQRLQVLFGRADWWSDPAANLHHPARRMALSAIDQVVKDKPRHAPADVVPALTFGFWVSLLGRGNDYETRLWRPALHRAFPGFRGKRTVLHSELQHLRKLRNRIMHHEPIHHRHLAADHATLLRAIGYVSAETADCVQRFDRVPQVLTKKHAVESGEIRPSF